MELCKSRQKEMPDDLRREILEIGEAALRYADYKREAYRKRARAIFDAKLLPRGEG